MWEVFQNRNLICGENSVDKIKDICLEEGYKKIFILVYSKGCARLEHILSLLKGIGTAAVVDDSIQGEPEIQDIERILTKLKLEKCDALAAVGGGSVLDSGKAAAMLFTNGGSVEDYQLKGRPVKKRTLPLISVPTTAGTGSEASKVSVVYNRLEKLKKSVYSPYMIAETVLLDPALTVGTPKEITASCGIDALSHAIESYVSLNATEYTEMMGIKAMELIAEYLPACMEHPGDMNARGKMLLASYFAGCALNAGIGLAHMIAQPVGGVLKVPHGDACSVFLPYAMEYNLDCCVDKFVRVAEIFKTEKRADPYAYALAGIEKVKDFIRHTGTPQDLKRYTEGINTDLDSMVQIISKATSHIKSNPKPVTEKAVREVLIKVI